MRYPRVAVVLLAVVVAGCTTLKRCGYEGWGRDDWQHPEEVVRALGLRAGDRVADLGSGSGYFTFRLANAVGPTGQVYAVDVDEAMNAYIAERAREKGVGNVGVILARYDDPLLPDAGVDMIFTSNTYHHLKHRTAYFRNARRYLRPGGRVAILDLAGKGWFDSLFGHWTPPETIRREMEAAGYRLAQEPGVVDRQSFLIFTAAAP
jgi:ubiquinone/menaquinone biosynthesis C-methylase UbiE